MDPSFLVDRQAIFPESSNACKTWNSRSDPIDQIKNTTFVHNCRHINADHLPVPNEIRVGDGVAWFSVLGWVLGKPCTSLSTFVAIISSLGERWFVCAEKKKQTGKGGEKIVMAVYTRLFQIGCGVTWKSHPWAGDTACEKCNKKFARTETYLTRNRKMVTRAAILHYIHIFLTHTTWLKQCGSWIRHSEAVSTTTDKVEQISGVKYKRPSKSSCLRFKMRNKKMENNSRFLFSRPLSKQINTAAELFYYFFHTCFSNLFGIQFALPLVDHIISVVT